MNNMVYTTLVIKDARRVNQWWKCKLRYIFCISGANLLIIGSVVCILLCIVLTGLTVTFSFHALLDNFNGNCVSGVNLVFVHIDEVTNATGETPHEDTLARFSYLRRLQPLLVGGRSQNYSDQLRHHFQSPYSDGTGTEDNALRLQNEEDLAFFESRKFKVFFFLNYAPHFV